MFTFIHFLILFFILLIVYQIFLAFANSNQVVALEGLTTLSYESYDDTKDISNNESLSLQNINNIKYLHSEFIDMSGNMAKMQEQINGLVAQQNEYTNQLTGGTPPTITGATDDDGSVTNENTTGS
jgi:hypothetical protein